MERPDVMEGGVYGTEWLCSHLAQKMSNFSTGDTPAGPASGTVPDMLEENRSEMQRMLMDGADCAVLLKMDNILLDGPSLPRGGHYAPSPFIDPTFSPSKI